MQVDFYHLAGPPGGIVARIAERILADGGRLLVVTDEAGIEALDTALWTYSADSFLPHGRADRGDAAAQPVLLSLECQAENGARAIALADGLWRDEALAFDRAFHFFDEGSIGAARVAWKTLADRDGVERRYWKQEGGRWSQMA